MLWREVLHGFFHDCVDVVQAFPQEGGVAGLSQTGDAHEGNVHPVKERRLLFGNGDQRSEAMIGIRLFPSLRQARAAVLRFLVVESAAGNLGVGQAQ